MVTSRSAMEDEETDREAEEKPTDAGTTPPEPPAGGDAPDGTISDI